VEGVSKHIYLSASTVNSSASQSKKPLQALSGAFPADKVSYFHWQALHSDRYHISLKGDATAEPLLIRVDSLSTAQPQWFYGLCCTVASVQAQQTFCAFKDIDPPGEKDVLNRFSQQEVPALTWTFEPAGLPIHVSWKHASGQGDRINSIWSGEELTEHWQKRIWPTIAASTEANLTLDAGSFGLIELSLTPIVIREEDLAWWTDERLLAQFIWLSRVATRRHDQAQIAVPVSLREAISQLRTQSIEYPLLYTALDRLARINVMPCWVLYRMRTLMTEIQKKQTGMKHRADKVKTMNYN